MDAYYASEAPAKAGLVFADGLWAMPRKAGPKVIAVPDTGDIRRDILHELHDSQYAGHPGMERTRQAIARLFWWPTLRPDVEAYVRGCMVCQRDKGRSGKKLGKLLPLAVPGGAWESVSLDFVGPLPETSRGHNMILTVVDRFSKMARFLPCRSDWNTEQVARLYVDRVFSMHGCPISIVSDRGPQFTSSFTTALCKLVGTKQFRSTAYHPQSNGSTERMNRVLGEMLRHFVNTRCDDWDRYLGLAEFANNNAFHKSTGTTPFVICYGKHPLSPVQAALARDCPTAADVFVGTRQDIVRLARKCLLQAQERMIAFENKGLRDEQFVVGNQVMLNTTNLNIHTMPSRKLFPKWMGPFTVTRVVNRNAYELELPAHWRIFNRFSIHLLKPWHDNGIRHPPMPFTLIGGQPTEFEVEEVLDHRPKTCRAVKKLQFLVRWHLHGPDSDTWEPFSNLKNCPDKLKDYAIRIGKPHGAFAIGSACRLQSRGHEPNLWVLTTHRLMTIRELASYIQVSGHTVLPGGGRDVISRLIRDHSMSHKAVHRVLCWDPDSRHSCEQPRQCCRHLAVRELRPPIIGQVGQRQLAGYRLALRGCPLSPTCYTYYNKAQACHTSSVSGLEECRKPNFLTATTWQ